MGVLFRAAGKKKRFAHEAPAAIVLTPTSVSGAIVGDTISLSAAVIGTQGNTLPLTIAWSSSNLAIATVSNFGVVTAVSAGSCVITARVGPAGAPVTNTLNLTVVAARVPTSVTVTPSTLTMQTGGVTNVYARVLDAAMLELTGQTVTWSSLTPATATVGSDSGDPVHTCQVTAVAAGTVTIRATSGILTADITLTVQTAGLYTAHVKRVWSDYANDAAMKAALTFGSEANLHTYRPAITPRDFVEHTTDAQYTGGIFPAVALYRGEIAMNLSRNTFRARTAGVAGNSIQVTVTKVATNVVNIVVKDDPTSPTVTETFNNLTHGIGAYTAINAGSTLVEMTDYSDLGNSAPSVGTYLLTGGAIGVKAILYTEREGKPTPGRGLTHTIPFTGLYNFWVRWYARFSTNWTTEQRTHPFGAETPDLKWVQGHNISGGGRLLVNVARLGRGYNFTPGINAIAPIVANSWIGLPGTNWQRTDAQYPQSYLPCLEGHTSPHTPFSTTQGVGGCPTGDGDGEWYEYIYHHNTKVGATRAESTFMTRKYTTGGGVTINPGPYLITGAEVTYASPMPAVYVNGLAMGDHRNGLYYAPMWQAWGPFEVVNGTTYADPFGTGYRTAEVT